MTERKASEQIIDLADRAERLTQDLAELRRRIDSRPRRRQSSSNIPAVQSSPPPPPPESEPEATTPKTRSSLPARRDTPSSSDTRLWLPVLKQRPPSRPSVNAALIRSASEPPPLNVTCDRSPGSSVRRKDPEAGRYSIIAAGRGKRRASS